MGKKAAHIVSDSESNNEIKSLGYSLTDDKEMFECLLNLPCLSCNKNRKKRHTKCKKGRKEKGEKTKKSNHVCERMIHNEKYPKDKKYMGTHCQYKIYGDTLPMQIIRGHIADTKYMGTHCQ